jgi:hypothetical protein
MSLFTREEYGKKNSLEKEYDALDEKCYSRIREIVSYIMKVYEEENWGMRKNYETREKYWIDGGYVTYYSWKSSEHDFHYTDEKGKSLHLDSYFPVEWLWTDITKEVRKGRQRYINANARDLMRSAVNKLTPEEQKALML